MVSGFDENRWLSIKLVYSNLKRVINDKKNLPLNMMDQVKIDYFRSLIDCYKNQIRSLNTDYKDIELLLKKMNNFQLFDSSNVKKLKGLDAKDQWIIWNIFYGNKLTNWILFKVIEVRYSAQKKRS